MKIAKFLFPLVFVACVSPDTQPVIDGILEWKRIENEQLTRHRQLLSVAVFDETDAVKNLESKARYEFALATHEQYANAHATALINWCRKVGEFDPEYANKTLDQMLAIYIQIRNLEKDKQ